MRARSTLITGVTIASVLAGAGLALSQAPSGAPGKPTTTTTAAGAKAPAKKPSRTCTATRRTPTVSYIFRGKATAVDATSVTVDLAGANAHGKALLKSADPSVAITKTTPPTDLLTATVDPAKTTVSRKDAAGTVTSTAVAGIVIGDNVVLQYRGPLIRKGATCVAPSAPSVTVASPGPGPLALSGLTLKRVTATLPPPA